ncbi:MAG TPA: hypothetical protein VIB99_03240 [Candidatus Limnocylindrales bacterium]
MVRAKSTDRAEARRRYRAATAAAEAEGPALASQPASARPVAGGSAPPKAARPGILGSFRTAVRPVNLKDDLRDLPRLATHTYALWVPALIMVVIFVLFEASGAAIGNQSLPSVAFNLFIFPPPLAASFLAGVLTQRSSYLAGGIIGLLAGILFAFYVMTAVGVSATGEAVTTDQRIQFAGYALLVSPVAGVAVGGFAGFYRRFLRLANPNSAKPPAKGSKQAARKR